ncbi:acyl-CoA Delta(11) desaturase-like [Cylas formicarius]|uniref:acyl-CoA Delta(11) desaturase-like n=1 Tax=Cylas formicarius TaxID=197179 RepID=UPI002958BBA1|nr:acyl-CoA Delta(11) desaturase-like [Cylas formicarius]
MVIDNSPNFTLPAITNKDKYKCFLGEFETPLVWKNIISHSILHIVAVCYIFIHDYKNHPWIMVYAYTIFVISIFGINGGAHRLWTHRSYKVKTPLKVILLVSYSTTGMYSVLDWVRDHRVHHKYSDTNADPHNINRGFLFAHVGWLCMKRHPDVIKKGREIDISDIKDDPLIRFHTKYYQWFRLFFCFVLPSMIPPLLWGEPWIVSILTNSFVKYAAVLNATWTVNSLAHYFGNKPYDKNLRPTQNLLVAFLTKGEGHHNFHHAFPWDYRASEFLHMFHVTTIAIEFFHKLGWAYDLKTVSPEVLRKTIERCGDGTHELSKLTN